MLFSNFFPNKKHLFFKNLFSERMIQLKPLAIVTTIICAAQCNVVDSVCSGGSFHRYINGHLNCGVFKTVIANSMECQMLCVTTPCCLSINTHCSGNGTEICELNGGRKRAFDDKSCFVEIVEHEYYELQVSDDVGYDNGNNAIYMLQ